MTVRTVRALTSLLKLSGVEHLYWEAESHRFDSCWENSVACVIFIVVYIQCSYKTFLALEIWSHVARQWLSSFARDCSSELHVLWHCKKCWSLWPLSGLFKVLQLLKPKESSFMILIPIKDNLCHGPPILQKHTPVIYCWFSHDVDH